jgi:UDP-N-acetylmuramoylalanine--D-glutamate ligase
MDLRAVTALPEGFDGNWRGLSAAVLGLGVTGFSVADTLAELGVHVTVFAAQPDPSFADMLDVIGADLVSDDAEIALAALVELAPDMVVVSPGFRPDHPLVSWASQNSNLISDIDLAWQLGSRAGGRPKWLLITGTNGKTTTTELTAAMLNSGGLRAAACGNIGSPILDAVRDPIGYEVLVVEISSFQLHYLRAAQPQATALLNIAEDHIDWHGSMDEYARVKALVYRDTEVAAIYNVDDRATERALENAEVIEGCRAIGFTLQTPDRSMVGYVDGILVDRAFLEDRANTALEIAGPEDIARLGVLSPHLLQNAAAAAALARSMGIAPAAIRETIRNFRLAPHRIQLVGQLDGINFIDDSKATNAHAARASLASFNSVVWIVGGLFKGVDPAPLLREFKDTLRGLVVIGAEAEIFEQAHEEVSPELARIRIEPGPDVMKRAVAAALEFAEHGDTVLLAPAAASQDQFRDYADRGNQFQDAVRALGASA